MAEQVGLSATLKFNAGSAVSQMRKARGAFVGMAKGAKMAKDGMANVKKGFAGARWVALGLSAGVVKTVKDFADFDFQMTKSISLTKDGAENVQRLTSFAKRMGAETFFTSKQAAEGMEILARTGLKTDEIMAALPKVLQLAAAEGLDLARAAEVVTKSGNQFGISMDEAGRIADTFAFVSKNTATNVDQLAEAMKFVGTKAGRSMNIPLEQTVGVAGLLANVAADASVGGTTLNNALIKIGKAAKGGKVRVGKFTAQIEQMTDPKTGKRGVNLVETMRNISRQAARIKDPVKRAAALTKLLGIRGEKASLAFSAAFSPEKAKETEKFFDSLNQGVEGAAKSLADAQINTVAGQFKIFQSAVSGVSIAVGQMILKNTPLVPFMQRVTVVLGDAAKAMSILSDKKMDPKEAREGLAKLGHKGVQVAMGLREGFAAVKEVFTDVGGVVKTVAGVFGVSFGGTIRDQIRTTAKTIAWTVSIVAAGKAMGRLASIAKGTFQIVRGGLAIAMSATGGVARVLGKHSPLLARVGAKLPGVAGKLAGVMSGAEKLTAQPVRVVNFDEAFGMGMGAGTAGKGGVGAIKGLGGFVKKTALAASNIQSLAGRLAAKGGLVAAAGAAGFAIGTLVDRTFGISDKISDRAVKAEREAAKAQVRMHEIAVNFKAQVDTLKKLQTLRGKTKTVGFGGKRVAITREFAEARLRARLSAEGKNRAQQDAIVKHLTGMLAKFPTKEEFLQANKEFTIVNEVKLDGKVIARNVAVKKEEQGQRRGVPSQPGEKRRRRVR